MIVASLRHQVYIRLIVVFRKKRLLMPVQFRVHNTHPVFFHSLMRFLIFRQHFYRYNPALPAAAQIGQTLFRVKKLRIIA
jgi:hypothetical protein